MTPSIFKLWAESDIFTELVKTEAAQAYNLILKTALSVKPIVLPNS